MRTLSSLFLGAVVLLCAVSVSHAFFWQWSQLASQPKSQLHATASNCAACTIIVGLIEQYSVIHEQAVEDVVAKVCTLFPAELQPTCTSLVDTFGPLVIEALENKLGADGACRKMEFCSSWPQCQLFPLPKESKPADAKFSQRYEEMVRSQYARMAGVSPWDWIKEQLERTFKTHLPLYDEDGDNFGASSLGPFRGSDWRGADCHDGDAQVYPGRGEPKRDDPFTDHNCNGIKGINIRGQSYEELLCGSTPGRGLILLSDSQGAHFRIPDHWMNASAINEDTYKHALFALENELDWPHLGAYTGHTTDQTGDTPGPVDSLYLRLYQRNHCNKANVQNIGVNGARIQTVVEELLPTMHINKTDSPALVFISLVGNDVCRSHDGDVAHMTQPDEFESYLLQALTKLDATLPTGSSVIFIGLVDGRILWNTLHSRTHPLGVSYEDVYGYLSCLHISPCQGWMTPNETIRNATSAQAALLSSVYKKVMAEHTFNSFNMAYYDYDVAAVQKILVERGGQPWELIEPIDGFHPSQIANSLFAEYFWNEIQRDHPDMLGQVNPNNAAIEAMFGKDPSW